MARAPRGRKNFRKAAGFVDDVVDQRAMAMHVPTMFGYRNVPRHAAPRNPATVAALKQRIAEAAKDSRGDRPRGVVTGRSGG